VLLESFLMPWRLRFHPWTPTQAVVRTFAESGKDTNSILRNVKL
jgi:hypothetical protein